MQKEGKVKRIGNLWNFFAWLTGIIVSLVVGLEMAEGSLMISFVPKIITMIAGWIVILTTVLSIALVLFRK